MGISSSSPAVESEKLAWNKPHRLEYDDSIREQHLRDIENFGKDLQLCDKTIFHPGNFTFSHWFITDGNWFMEYGTGEANSLIVSVHNNKSRFVNLSTGQISYVVHEKFRMTDEVKRRMSKVCGATNYSLCLRNGEQLAQYIYCGTWVSFQMASGTGRIRKQFKNNLTVAHCKLINTAPAEIEEEDENVGGVPIYAECDTMLQFLERSSRLVDNDSRNYSVLFLGPTGAGKSRLINMLFNQHVTKSLAGALSVTRDVVFLKGKTHNVSRMIGLHDSSKDRNVNIIDTIGLCDSLMTKAQVYDCIKDKVRVNMMYIDVVVVVLSGRIERVHVEAIKQYMAWLKYEQFLTNFVFVYNKADELKPDLIARNLLQMGELLDVDTTQHFYNPKTMEGADLTFATSFPPRAEYSEIKNHRDKFLRAVLIPRKRRLEVIDSSCLIL